MGDGPFVGTEDCYIVVECAGVPVAEHVASTLEQPPAAYGALVSAAVYRFRMDLSASSLKSAAVVG